MNNELPSGVKPLFIIAVSPNTCHLIYDTGSIPGTLAISMELAKKLEASGTEIIDVVEALRKQGITDTPKVKVENPGGINVGQLFE